MMSIRYASIAMSWVAEKIAMEKPMIPVSSKFCSTEMVASQMQPRMIIICVMAIQPRR
jgi:hypothetical protein